MASEELIGALDRRIEIVPVRRGWWVTRAAPGSARIASHWERMIGRRPQEDLMLGGGGAA